MVYLQFGRQREQKVHRFHKDAVEVFFPVVSPAGVRSVVKTNDSKPEIHIEIKPDKKKKKSEFNNKRQAAVALVGSAVLSAHSCNSLIQTKITDTQIRHQLIL